LKKKLREDAIKKGYIQPAKQNPIKKFFAPLFDDNFRDESLDDEIVKPKAKNPWEEVEDN
jgi:hypothetical protein